MGMSNANATAVKTNEITTHNGYEISDLREIFSEVQNPENWKYSIKACVAESMVDRYVTAIEFFVGGPTKVTRLHRGALVPDLFKLENQGYYFNIGA